MGVFNRENAKNDTAHHICFKRLLPLLLLFFLIVLIYSNTFKAEWHLDDYANIAHNPNIHIKDLGLKSLGNTFYFKPDDKKISRPFARLTFGLNWYVGKNNVVGYHIVNLSIHVLTAFLLFLFILKLFGTPNLKDKYPENDAYFIAMLSTVLWAAHPIQTQAVTYIVQRMASMAAMFYIMSMYLYLKGRLVSLPKRKTLFYILAFISFGLGLATKENAAMLPISIVLMEVLFFKDFKNPKTRNKFIWVSAFFCGIVILFASWLFLNNGLTSLFKESGFRYFTPMQRLMTEPRVIVFYISEIFYPVPARFSIEHDFTLSTSLIEPWTTLPAILFIVFLVCFGAMQMKKRPLLSFGILFFFLNHFIESIVPNLEIIFEHRNYLPSFFLFLYISAVIKWMLDQYHKKNKVMHSILTVFVIFMVMSFGISTYVRNMDWKTGRSILKDSMQKAPHSARPLSNLAMMYYNENGRSDVALRMFHRALTLNMTNTYQESIILYSIGKIYYYNGNLNEAIKFLEKAVEKPPHHDNARYMLAVALADLGKYKEAKRHLDKIISKPPVYVNPSLNLKGIILLKEKKHKEASHLFRKCLGIKNNNKNALLNTGVLYFLTGDYRRAEMFFETAYTHHPEERIALLWLIETNLKLKDNQDVKSYINDLFLTVSAKGILALPRALSDENTFESGIIAPPSNALLIEEIKKRLKI